MYAPSDPPTATYQPDSHGTYRGGWRGVTIDHAARQLGVSPTTIRRWVKDGRIKSERVARPQGYVVLVELPASAPSTPDQTTPPQIATTPPATAPTEVARADAMAIYLAAYAKKITAPLVATIAEQAELIGELKTRLAAFEAPKPDPDPEAPVAAMWQARAETLADQLDQAQRAYQAPKPETVTVEPTPEMEAVSAPAPRPWWRWWFG
jgi:excisionase family DNA binding protein